MLRKAFSYDEASCHCGASGMIVWPSVQEMSQANIGASALHADAAEQNADVDDICVLSLTMAFVMVSWNTKGL